MGDVVIGVDIGTSSSKAVAWYRRGCGRLRPWRVPADQPERPADAHAGPLCASRER